MRLRWVSLIAAKVVLLATVLSLIGCDSSATLPPRTGPVWTPSGPDATQPLEATKNADWLRFNFDPARSGVNPNETSLTPTTVSGLHRLWSVTLPDVADSTPILVHGLMFADGSKRNVIYVTTKPGSLVALDAATGAQLWAAATRGPKITNSSPVADPAHGFVYSYGLDGSLHKYHDTTGQEVTSGGWPVLITKMTQTEKESSSLNLANGFIYVTTSGYVGDAPPYQGHLVAVNLADATTHVYNSLCSDKKHVLAQGECEASDSGIWARAGAVVDPVTGFLFVSTGNGPFDANTGGNNWGDTVLELSADGSRLIDSYTPPNFQQLEASDLDLSSNAPAILPKIAASKTPYLAVQGGKDGVLRLLDRQNLSGRGGPGHVGGELQTVAAPGNCVVFTQPAVWTNPANGTLWVFVATGCGTIGYQVVTSGQGATTLKVGWSMQQPGTSPVIAGGMLFLASSGAIVALDPQTGKQLWSSANAFAGGTIGGIHWESPIVLDGKIYCADETGKLTAYGL
ncbi:MAG TPA: PQQ-binding-like beta-propeller repeat protein [Ktedonobacterales bacterium]|jgi:outer membrane protein assembly factor BamB